jgi:DNA-binding CsgD family transcriptional regulator
MSSRTPMRGLNGERARIRRLVESVRDGHGDALVLDGQPGSGLTTLLDAAAEMAPDLTVLRIAGVRPEKNLPFAAVHRLVDVAADAAADLRELHRTFCLLADSKPLLCLVDDLHWLDEPSLNALAFVARRCAGRPFGFVFAGNGTLAGIDHLRPAPLDVRTADQLLADRADIPQVVRACLIESSGGVPGQLVELAGELRPAHLAGRLLPPEVLPVGGRCRTELVARLAEMSPDAWRLVLLVACEDWTDVSTLDRIGLGRAVLDEAVRQGLVIVTGTEAYTPTPAIRATVYAEATEQERKSAHAVLAGALTEPEQRVQRIWHRVAAMDEPDAAVADELAAAASGANPAMAAKALYRAAQLTVQREQKVRHMIGAAMAAWSAGMSLRAKAILAQARLHAEAPGMLGEIALLHGEIDLRSGEPVAAAQELAAAAESLRDGRQRAIALTQAGEARRMVGDLRGYGAIAEQVSKSDIAGAAPIVAAHFEGLAATFRGDHVAATEPLWRAAKLGLRVDDVRQALLAVEAALTLGQVEVAFECATAAVGRARLAEEHAMLPSALAHLASTALVLDRHRIAVAAATEGRATSVAAGQGNTEVENLTMLALAAVSAGERENALALLDTAMPVIRERGLGKSGAYAAWARACVDLLDDRPDEALGKLRTMATGAGKAHPAVRVLATPQLVEAAVRCDRRDLAQRAATHYERWAMTTNSPLWKAFSCRCKGLLALTIEEAGDHYENAIALHRSAGATLELARTQLLYAQRLRRTRQSRAARELLRDALRLFQSQGTEFWEARVLAELRVAGDGSAGGSADALKTLTPQQAQIARLVAGGDTNREIARTLVISHRTVDHHLRNIFVRLGIRSRAELTALFVRHEMA